MHAGDISLVENPNPHSDEAFQRLLLQISSAASDGLDPDALIHLFCREARVFFQVSGVYFWHVLSPDEMVGAQADGLMAERFVGLRLKSSESAVTVDALRSRRTELRSKARPIWLNKRLRE